MTTTQAVQTRAGAEALTERLTRRLLGPKAGAILQLRHQMARGRPTR